MKVKDMFYVHWNTVVRKIKIHRGDCGACKEGQGMHEGRISAGRGETYDWIEARTYDEAKSIATEVERRKPVLKKGRGKWDCGLCRPARER
jgi:hypothetical protein